MIMSGAMRAVIRIEGREDHALVRLPDGTPLEISETELVEAIAAEFTSPTQAWYRRANAPVAVEAMRTEARRAVVSVLQKLKDKTAQVR